jgi:hypothetical protein
MRGSQRRGCGDRTQARDRDLGEPDGRQLDRRDRSDRRRDLELRPDRRAQHDGVRKREREDADQAEPVPLSARAEAADAETAGARAPVSAGIDRPHRLTVIALPAEFSQRVSNPLIVMTAKPSAALQPNAPKKTPVTLYRACSLGPTTVLVD